MTRHEPCNENIAVESSVVVDTVVSVDNPASLNVNVRHEDNNGSDESNLNIFVKIVLSLLTFHNQQKKALMRRIEMKTLPILISSRKKFRYDHIQRLVQLVEKKLYFGKKKGNREEKQANNEDLKFFESLFPHLKLTKGVDKLMFRNEVQNLVMKYAYHAENQVQTSTTQSTVLDSERSSFTQHSSRAQNPSVPSYVLTNEDFTVMASGDIWNATVPFNYLLVLPATIYYFCKINNLIMVLIIV